MGTPVRRPQLAALTSLRFFAAFHVLVYHVQGWVLPSLGGHPWLRNLVTTGASSVGLFFVLSGFILAYTYLGPPEEGRLKRGPFWAARFARVYPVYLFALVVAAPLWVLGFLRFGATPGRFALVAATVLTLVQAWTPELALAWNGPSWSLSAEAFFYLLFPFVAPALWPLRRRRLLLCLAAFWGLAQLGPALYTFAPPGGWLGGWQPLPEYWTAAVEQLPYMRLDNPGYTLLQYNPAVRLPEFLFGVALGRLFLLQAPARRTAVWSLTAAAGAVAVLAALAGAPPAVRNSIFFHNGLLTPLFGLLICGLAGDRLGLLGRLLSLRPLVVLGEASYALYLLHVPLRSLVGTLMERLAINSMPNLLLFVSYTTAALLISVAVLRGVEEPARRFLRRRLAR